MQDDCHDFTDLEGTTGLPDAPRAGDCGFSLFSRERNDNEITSRGQAAG
jgi:hypothetical protein